MNLNNISPLNTGQNCMNLDDLSNGQDSNLYLNHDCSDQLSKRTESEKGILEPLFEIWKRVELDVQLRKREPEHKIGLSEIDNITWGIRKKVLMTIGARTSHGKTSFAVHTMKNLADMNNRIIYFTMETSKEQLLEKLFCNFCRVNSLELLHGNALTVFNEKKDLFMRWIDDVKILIDDKHGYNFDLMLDVIDTIKPDFVFVDYIQMISAKGYRSKVDAIEEYVRKFAELAVTKNFGAILISQINRSGVDEPTMSKFKWAGVLEEHSRIAIILSYDKNKGKYKVHVEKNSFGETGEFYVKFEPQYSSFRDLTEEEVYEIEQKKKTNNKTGGLYS